MRAPPPPPASSTTSTSIVDTLQTAALVGRLQQGSGWHAWQRHRLSSLALSRWLTVATSQLGGLRWLDLDAVEERYLLTGAADSTIEAFDTRAADDQGGHVPTQLQPVFSIKRTHPAAHRYQVTGVLWYPVDTGMFVSGSADQDVKVWDTNELQVACSFRCADKVTTLAMSGCAVGHALIAVGSKQPEVVLADMVSGAFTHTLDGHKAGVWALCWSACNEHQLLTGDGTGTVRLWDIRRAGCRAVLDMACSAPPPRKAAAAVSGSGRGGGSGSGSSSSGAAGSRKRRQQQQRGDDLRQQREAQLKQQQRQRASDAAPALAHEGAVTAIHGTADTRCILTAGADHRVRLWDAGGLHHLLVHYADTFNRGLCAKRLASTPDGRVAFVPRGSDVQVLDVHRGQQLALLSQGHYDAVCACAFSPSTGRLWSAGLDGAVLAWEPRPQDGRGDDAGGGGHAMDAWLAAAAAGRGSSRQQHAAAAGDGGGRPGRAARAPLPDIDFWSDDEHTLIGGG